MKNNKIFMIVMAVIAVLVVAVVSIAFILNHRAKRNDILAQDEIQAEMLSELYTSFLGNFSTAKCNVQLDKTCLKNFVTGAKFEGENLDKIKSVEKVIDDAEWTYELSMKYNKSTKEITMIFNNVDLLDRAEQKYKLSYEDDKITFEKTGNANYIIE